jgi:hypothetical protein
VLVLELVVLVDDVDEEDEVVEIELLLVEIDDDELLVEEVDVVVLIAADFHAVPL